MVDPTIVVAAIGTVGTIIVAIIQTHHGRRVKEVHEQVKNSHPTNLRADVDEIKAELRRQGEEIAQLRADIRVDRLIRGTVYGRAAVPTPRTEV